MLIASPCVELGADSTLINTSVFPGRSGRPASTEFPSSLHAFLTVGGTTHLFTLAYSHLLVNSLSTSLTRKVIFHFGFLPLIAPDPASNSVLLATTQSHVLRAHPGGHVVIVCTLPVTPVALFPLGDVLYVADRKGCVSAVSGGETLWTWRENCLYERLFRLDIFGFKIFAIAATDRVIFALTDRADLFMLDRESGAKIARLSLGPSIASGFLRVFAGGLLVAVLRTKGECYVRSYVVRGRDIDAGPSLTRPRSADVSFSNGRLAVLSGKDLFIYLVGVSGLVFVSQVRNVEIEWASVYMEGERILLANSEALGIVRPTTALEQAVFAVVNDTENSVLRCCKVLREWIGPDDSHNFLRIADRVVNRIRASGVSLPFSEERVVAELRSLFEMIPTKPSPVRVTGDSSAVFWRAVLGREILPLIFQTIIQVIVFLRLEGRSDFLAEFEAAFRQYEPLLYLVNEKALPDFFTAPIDTFLYECDRQIGHLLDCGSVCEYLQTSAQVAVLQHFAEATNRWPACFTAYVRRGRLRDALRVYEERQLSLDDSGILELLRALRGARMSRDLVRFVDGLGNATPVMFSYMFVSALDAHDFLTAFECIKRCGEDERVVDFVRLFVMSAIDCRQLPEVFRFDFGARLSVVLGEMLCYSVRTVAAAAMLYWHIGDVHGALGALYLYARTQLRTVTRGNLERAVSALVLLLSVWDCGTELSVRSVSDQSLVTRRSIVRLLTKVEIVLSFANPAKKFGLSNGDILRSLWEAGNWELMTKFASICTSDDLAKFSVFLVGQPSTAYGAIAAVLVCDKRKWNWKLHTEVLREFLRQRLAPPVWLVDELSNKAKPSLIAMANQYRTLDILEDVFGDLDREKEKVSRYLRPLLEQTLAVPGMPESLQRIVRDLIASAR
jgi:hypothetical protein